MAGCAPVTPRFATKSAPGPAPSQPTPAPSESGGTTNTNGRDEPRPTPTPSRSGGPGAGKPSKEPGREHGWFNPGNLNSLLSTYTGAFGIKPGYTEDAGYTLVAAAERDGRMLVAVTLNSRRHFSDATALLDFGFKRQ